MKRLRLEPSTTQTIILYCFYRSTTQGYTPLHLAMQFGRDNIFELLCNVYSKYPHPHTHIIMHTLWPEFVYRITTANSTVMGCHLCVFARVCIVAYLHTLNTTHTQHNTLTWALRPGRAYSLQYLLGCVDFVYDLHNSMPYNCSRVHIIVKQMRVVIYINIQWTHFYLHCHAPYGQTHTRTHSCVPSPNPISKHSHADNFKRYMACAVSRACAQLLRFPRGTRARARSIYPYRLEIDNVRVVWPCLPVITILRSASIRKPTLGPGKHVNVARRLTS